MATERGRVVTYKWENFENNITEAFRRLQKDESHQANVTLSAEGWCLKAHQFVLSAFSPYFRGIFAGLSAWQHPVIVIKDTSFVDVQLLLKFIYNGSVDLQENQIETFLEAGKSLQIEGISGDTELIHVDADDTEEDIGEEDEDANESEMEELVLESTRTLDGIEGLREGYEQSRNLGGDVSNISIGIDQDRMESSMVLTPTLTKKSMEVTGSRRKSKRSSATRSDLSLNHTGEEEADGSKASCVICEVLMTKKNIARHMRNVHLLESAQVSEILNNSFLNKTTDVSLEAPPTDLSANTPEPMDTPSTHENDPDDTSILSGMESMLARHSKSINSSSNNLSKSKRRKSKRRRKCDICGVQLSAGSMSRHLRNVHEILPKLRSDTELTTSAETSLNVSFLALGSKYRLTKPLESRRSLMSKHSNRLPPYLPSHSKPTKKAESSCDKNLVQYSREKTTEVTKGHKVPPSADIACPGAEVSKELGDVGSNNKASYSTNSEVARTEVTPDTLAHDIYLNNLAEAFENQGEVAAISDPVAVETNEKVIDKAAAPPAKKTMCRQCGMQVTAKNMKRHVVARHSQPDSAPCQAAKKQRNLSSSKS